MALFWTAERKNSRGSGVTHVIAESFEMKSNIRGGRRAYASRICLVRRTWRGDERVQVRGVAMGEGQDRIQAGALI